MKRLEKKIIQRRIAEAREERRRKKAEKAAGFTGSRSLWKATEKLRRGFVHVVFSRAALILAMVLLQAVLFFMMAHFLPVHAARLQTLFITIGVIVVITIINSEGSDAMKLTWMVFIMIFPFVGSLFYIYVKNDVGVRSIRKRLDTIRVETASYLRSNPRVRHDLRETYPDMDGISGYLARQVGFPTYDHTKTVYYPSGEKFFEVLLPELEQAESYIFMEFFIVDAGDLWDRVLAVLKQKVEEGVEVRLMYDGMCSINKLPLYYWKTIAETGIKCKVFNQIKPVVSSVQNHRDHRKICVIDGKIAYTGGVNIADEYINKKERFGHWKDAGIRVEGDAVRSFIVLFLQMWGIDEPVIEDYNRFMPESRNRITDGNGFVIPYGDSPFDNEDVGRTVYLWLLQRANRYVHITTPYLVLDKGVRRALCQAAKCGVQVRIIMPHIPDKHYAYVLGRSYYKELLSAGVQIFEYTEGFMHAKAWVVDDLYATVGSVNLDFRSLYLHFECGICVFDPAVAMAVERDYKDTLKSCQRISMVDVENRSLIEKLFGWALRVVAPLI